MSCSLRLQCAAYTAHAQRFFHYLLVVLQDIVVRWRRGGGRLSPTRSCRSAALSARSWIASQISERAGAAIQVVRSDNLRIIKWFEAEMGARESSSRRVKIFAMTVQSVLTINAIMPFVYSINQSINQPINKSINQPINQSINQPTNQSINHLYSYNLYNNIMKHGT